MKRRTFVLWGGALGTISLSLSASSAAFAYDVSPLANFHVSPKKPEASLSIVDNTENELTTHEWFITPLYSDANTDTITIEYPSGTSFANVTDNDVTIEFLQSNGTRDVKFDGTYSTSTAEFNITDNNAEIVREARVLIENNLENPSAGTYSPTITFTDVTTDANTITVPADMAISAGDVKFEIGNFAAPTEVTVGDNIFVDYLLENNYASIGSEEITTTIDGADVGNSPFTETIEGGGSSDLDFTYTTSKADTPTVIAEVAGEFNSDSQTVAVGGEFGLDLTTYKQRQSATHSWTTGFLDSFADENVDTITVRYDNQSSGGGGNGNTNDFDFDGLTSSEVTLTIEGNPISIVNGPWSGKEAMFDLDPNQATDINGIVSLEFTLKNPKADDFKGTITLEGEQGTTHTSDVLFTIS